MGKQIETISKRDESAKQSSSLAGSKFSKSSRQIAGPFWSAAPPRRCGISAFQPDNSLPEPISKAEKLLSKYDLVRGAYNVRTAAGIAGGAQGKRSVNDVVKICAHLQRDIWGSGSDDRAAATLAAASSLSGKPVEVFVKAYEELRKKHWGTIWSDKRAAAVLSASAVVSGRPIAEALRNYDHIRNDLLGRNTPAKVTATLAAAATISGKSGGEVVEMYSRLRNLRPSETVYAAAVLAAGAAVGDVPVEEVIRAYHRTTDALGEDRNSKAAAATLAASSIQSKFVFVNLADLYCSQNVKLNSRSYFER